jgi:acetyl-CoA carboxylase carboxyl transferase subunit alpha
MKHFLDFEKPIAELEGKIEELRHLSGEADFNIADEVSKLQAKTERLLRQTYQKLTPWQKVQVARHPDRPHFNDYVAALIQDFTPVAGDRCFADDKAILGGFGRFRGYSCVVIGQEKGADTNARVAHNFGMARPEGYRKARRLMELADRFSLPIISLVDTPGAYPGVGAEERGQAEAIARERHELVERERDVVAEMRACRMPRDLGLLPRREVGISARKQVGALRLEPPQLRGDVDVVAFRRGAQLGDARLELGDGLLEFEILVHRRQR